MTRASLAALLLLLGCAALLPGETRTSQPMQELSIRPALLAPFSAASAKVKGETLILTDLRDIDENTQGRQLAGRVLLQGDKDVLLALWVLKVGGDMARATPLLGHEGPGQTFLNPGRPGGENRFFDPPATFRRPVRLTLIPLDPRGAPRPARQVTIRTIELAGGRGQ